MGPATKEPNMEQTRLTHINRKSKVRECGPYSFKAWIKILLYEPEETSYPMSRTESQAPVRTTTIQ